MPSSSHFPDCFYRVSVKALIVRDEKVLLVHEPPELSGQWELPGGGLDFGEGFQEALAREIFEETGLKVVHVAGHPTYLWTSKFERRREMEWYYALALCFVAEVESLDFKVTDECDDVAFFSKEELQAADLHHQTLPLRNVFNPADFTKGV